MKNYQKEAQLWIQLNVEQNKLRLESNPQLRQEIQIKISRLKDKLF